jgi:hypothetical protein
MATAVGRGVKVVCGHHESFGTWSWQGQKWGIGIIKKKSADYSTSKIDITQLCPVLVHMEA